VSVWRLAGSVTALLGRLAQGWEAIRGDRLRGHISRMLRRDNGKFHLRPETRQDIQAFSTVPGASGLFRLCSCPVA